MNIVKSKIEYKLLSNDELIISLDRLSRFKLPSISYNRVFNDILLKCLLKPKYSKSELQNLPKKEISKMVEKIWNDSVVKIYGDKFKNNYNRILKTIANYSFKINFCGDNELLNTKLVIEPILSSIDYNTAPVNLKLLIKGQNAENIDELLDISKKCKLRFPVKKLIIVEGITEEILLPVFAQKLNKNFDENGIFVLGAGGKSKSPSLYMQLKNELKIPVVLLFDSDAGEICQSLEKQLLNKDKIILIEKGEFEDILSLNLLKRSLNKEYQPATLLTLDELKLYPKMCNNIENFYRTRHLGEFKKAKLSKIIAENINYKTDISDEISVLIDKIIE